MDVAKDPWGCDSRRGEEMAERDSLSKIPSGYALGYARWRFLLVSFLFSSVQFSSMLLFNAARHGLLG